MQTRNASAKEGHFRVAEPDICQLFDRIQFGALGIGDRQAPE
jgi:hypothetical protein